MKCSPWSFSAKLSLSGEQCGGFLKRFVLVSVLFLVSNLLSQEQPQDKGRFEIDLSDLQKEVDKVSDKPYSLGGFAEFQPTLLGIDRDSAVSRARFYRSRPDNPFDQYNFRLRLEGSFKKDWFSAFFKTDTLVRNDFKAGTKILNSLKPTHR